MAGPRKILLQCAVSLLALGFGPHTCCAQYGDPWQGQSISERAFWVPTLQYIKTDVEAEQDTFHSTLGGSQGRNQRLYVAPAVGISWNDYIYHPYLLTYSLLFEPGYVWLNEGPVDAMQRSDEVRLNGHFRLNILQMKPYATTLNYDRAHEEVKYDFFNSALVDTESWGGSTGYREGPVPVTASFQETHEDSSGFSQRILTDQTMFDVRARNQRKEQDATDLDYQYGQLDRETETGVSSIRSENTYHHLMATDSEHFHQSSLRSTLLFQDTESSQTGSTDLNAALNYNLDLNPHLRHYDNYSFTWFSGDGSESVQNYAATGIQHQLYESLTSGLELHGSTLNSSSLGSTLDSVSAGTSASVVYTKRLGAWGRLSLDTNPSYNWYDQQTSGSELVIPNESHVVPNNGLVRLNQPRVTSVSSVTDASGTALLFGLDYLIIKSTDPWQVQVLSTGPSHIQPGSVILVTYTVQANPTGSYTVLANQSQLTLRFWYERADVFVRYRFAENETSSAGFVLQDEEELQTGGDFSWGGLNLHGDYTDHRSTLYNFVAYNLLENYAISTLPDSSLSLDFSQQWTTYSGGSTTPTNPTQELTYYNFMVRYEWHPTTRFNWAAEAGYRRQRGVGLDQDLFAARTYLSWSRGRLEVRLGYEHENQELARETRERDFTFLRLKRTF